MKVLNLFLPACALVSMFVNRETWFPNLCWLARKIRAWVICSALLALPMFGQSVDRAFFNTTTVGVSGAMLGGSVYQFHQLTILPSDVTAGSCSGGWAGVIYLQASMDNTTWFQIGLSLTSAASGSGVFTSTSGSFLHVRVNYASGNTSLCALTAWYSGTNTGVISTNIPGLTPVVPAQIAGNRTLFSGQQAVTGTAVALTANAAAQVCVKAEIANTINVYIGPSGVTTSTGDELGPGEARCLPVVNTNLIFVVASTTGAKVTWSGTAN